MDKYIKTLGSIKLPQFVLIKNLAFEHKEDLDAPIIRGEIINSSMDFDALRDLIPDPALPEEDYKLNLFEEKYGNASIVDPEYDDSTMDVSVGDPCDFDIFNESYTILWLTKPEIEFIVDHLLIAYKKKRNLVSIWDTNIDRIHIFPFYSLDSVSDDFYEHVCNSFEVQVNKLSNPPSLEEWQELNEFL